MPQPPPTIELKAQSWPVTLRICGGDFNYTTSFMRQEKLQTPTEKSRNPVYSPHHSHPPMLIGWPTFSPSQTPPPPQTHFYNPTHPQSHTRSHSQIDLYHQHDMTLIALTSSLSLAPPSLPSVPANPPALQLNSAPSPPLPISYDTPSEPRGGRATPIWAWGWLFLFSFLSLFFFL